MSSNHSSTSALLLLLYTGEKRQKRSTFRTKIFFYQASFSFNFIFSIFQPIFCLVICIAFSELLLLPAVFRVQTVKFCCQNQERGNSKHVTSLGRLSWRMRNYCGVQNLRRRTFCWVRSNCKCSKPESITRELHSSVISKW